MKRLLLLFCILMLVAPAGLLAHKPLLMVDDNQDGTIYVETGFSDGSTGAGHVVRIKDAATGSVLKETRVPDEGVLDLKKPSVPYLVEFDAGDGHAVELPGPAPSKAGQDEASSAAPPAEVATQPVPPNRNTPSSDAGPESTVSPPLAVVEPGFSAAYQMMIGTQVFTAVGVFLVFGVLMFAGGQRWEKNRQQRLPRRG